VIVDTSALVALVMVESASDAVLEAVARAPLAAVAAPSLVEACMVIDGRRARHRPSASARLALILARFDIAIVGFEAHHWPVAWSAFLRYGKGRHPAGLNFGDCLTYAVAKLSGEPLLCVGDDFARTDLELVPLGG
jgi:ribonuclease VapC